MIHVYTENNDRRGMKKCLEKHSKDKNLGVSVRPVVGDGEGNVSWPFKFSSGVSIEREKIK
jgi:hypothetical protein